VPTSGLCHAKAASIARFLDFAAGAGQSPGVNPGQLPSGYLPLPPKLRAQARKAATEVRNQTGCSGGSGGGGGGGGGGRSSAPGGTPGDASPGAGGTPSPGSASPQPSVSLPGANALGSVRLVAAAHPQTSAFTRYVLPGLLILGGLTALGGSLALGRSENFGPRVRRGAK